VENFSKVKILDIGCGVGAMSLYFSFLGMWGSRASEKFAYFVDDLMANFIDGYVYIAPFVIFLIVTPAFAKILNEREANGKGFCQT